MGMHRTFRVYAENKDGSEIIENDELCEELINALEDVASEIWEEIGGDDSFCVEAYDANWYDCHEDMVEMSRRYPDLVFTLCCDGETQDDVWEEGFCDGRSDYVHVETPELDMGYLRTGIKSGTRSVKLTADDMRLIIKSLNIVSAMPDMFLHFDEGGQLHAINDDDAAVDLLAGGVCDAVSFLREKIEASLTEIRMV